MKHLGIALLLEQLAAGNLLARIDVAGRYNAATLRLTAPRASFEFARP